MRLHNKLASSEANGPGSRAVIWFQGCTLKCNQCWNPGTHSFDTAEIPISSVQNWLMSLPGIDGVTFSGGEPIQSLPELTELCAFIRDQRPGLSIGMFTGYTLRELEAGRFHYMDHSVMVPGSPDQWHALCSLLDFAVCGRYNAQQNTAEFPLCGSENQRIELFSARYTLNDFSRQITEVTISDSGLVQITGFPGLETLQNLTKELF